MATNRSKYSDTVLKNLLGETAILGFEASPIFRDCLSNPSKASEALENLIKSGERGSRALPNGQDLFEFVTENAGKMAELRREIVQQERERDEFERECFRLRKALDDAECQAQDFQAAQQDEIEFWRSRAEGSIVGRIARWRAGY